MGMETFALSNGTELTIRPIRPDDEERLRAAHARLSPESRYRRFLAAKPTLSSADARYLVDIDGANHFALVATVPEAPAGEAGDAIVAVARFVRVPDDDTAAEFAIVVGDDYQRQGLAVALIDRLAKAAAERGITRFRATILSDNIAILRLLEQLAEGQLDVVTRGNLSEVEVHLGARQDFSAHATRGMIAACPGS